MLVTACRKYQALRKTYHAAEVLSGIGGFGVLVEISKKFTNRAGIGNDGVGTKLKLAFELNRMILWALIWLV